MFTEARIKLTAWYLAIIMAISLSFSVAIYLGVNRELSRFDVVVRLRQQRADQATLFLRSNGIPVPPDNTSEVETAEAARVRIITLLGLINLSILILAGGGGYFLAGQTLEPISKMVEEQKEFVGNASHELRTPLTSLMSEIEVALRDKKMNIEDARKLLESNLEDVKSMSKLSNYLLKLSRYERAVDTKMFTKVDLKEIAAKSIENVKPLSRAKKIDVSLKGAKKIVSGDKDSLVELFTILIENAIKYSPKESKVLVHINDRGFEVADHGVGISKEDLPHIFERFYRADTSRSKDKTDGYGLGLSIAKSITELHRGTIKVESKINKGTTFKIAI